MNSLDVKHSLIGNIHLIKAINGHSAYDIACLNGFKGTEKEWLDSLNGYGIARLNGFKGTEEEWLASLKGDKGDPGDIEMFGEFDALGHRIKNVALPQEDGDAVPYSTVKDAVKVVDISSDFIGEVYDGFSVSVVSARRKVNEVVACLIIENKGSSELQGSSPIVTLNSEYFPKDSLCFSANAYSGDEFYLSEIDKPIACFILDRSIIIPGITIPVPGTGGVTTPDINIPIGTIYINGDTSAHYFVINLTYFVK